MRASTSSIKFWNFFFHCGGMILRTGSLHRFESASQHPVRALSERLAGLLRQTQGAKAHLGTQRLF
jgi:hypothetical protein